MTAIFYDPRALEQLAALEERHFWFRVRRQIIIDALRRWFPRARDYLEVGSGTGYVARGIQAAFPDWRVIASDPLASAPGILRLDAHAVPLASAFDVIGAYDVLEHIDDDRAVLEQLHKACRPGGGLVLTVPQHRCLWSAADTNAQHRRRYSRGDLLGKLRASGYEILEATSFNTLNLPAFALRLLLLGATGRDPGAAIPPAPLNGLLAAGMQADRWLIRARVALPVGASLLVAARRQGAR